MNVSTETVERRNEILLVEVSCVSSYVYAEITKVFYNYLGLTT